MSGEQDLSPARRSLAPLAAGGGIAAALSGAAAGLCCVGPASVSLLGVSGAVAAAGLAPYRVPLLTLSVALLALAFWLASQRRNREAVCSVTAQRGSRTLLWLGAASLVGAFVLPRWLA